MGMITMVHGSDPKKTGLRLKTLLQSSLQAAQKQQMVTGRKYGINVTICVRLPSTPPDEPSGRTGLNIWSNEKALQIAAGVEDALRSAIRGEQIVIHISAVVAT